MSKCFMMISASAKTDKRYERWIFMILCLIFKVLALTLIKYQSSPSFLQD